MPIIAGIDEAGYGPLLGPLVVSCAAFRVATREPDQEVDLWDRIGPSAVLREVPRAGSGKRRSARDDALVVRDSKKVYQQGKGLRCMEATVLSFVTAGAASPDGGPAASSLSALLSQGPLGTGRDGRDLEPYPWYFGRDLELPHWGFRTVLAKQVASLRRALAAADVEALALAPRAVHPVEFNTGVRRDGNKHLFEWGVVAGFLRELWDRHGGEGVLVTCDKLGGRDFYGPPLARLFPEARVTAPLESGARSSYRIEHGSARMSVTFLVEGDGQSFPVALASCCSKYVRELYMHLMNRFFVERLPGLRETAGYYEDGRRFAEDVRAEMRRLSLDEAVLLRCC